MSKRMKFQGSDGSFMKNGRLLLVESVSIFNGSTNPIRCLSVDELNNDFGDWYIWPFEDLFSTWYKSVWDGRAVLVKSFNTVSNDFQSFQCCREIVVAAQMGIHKNVHKLLACCLETEFPVLIYEFVHNGSLQDRILRDKNENKPPLKWQDRLRIACEISHAIAYLHSAFPQPIIHRDLKPKNVFLDRDNAAKLADFSLCVSIPKGETHYIDDSIVGSFVYLAPEYARQGKSSEYSDVFSFGMLLFVLLTGHHPSPFFMKNLDLLGRAKECLKEEHICEIADPVIIGNGRTITADEVLLQQLMAYIELVLKCMAFNENSRPSMVEVAAQLRNIIASSVSDTSTNIE